MSIEFKQKSDYLEVFQSGNYFGSICELDTGVYHYFSPCLDFFLCSPDGIDAETLRAIADKLDELNGASE